MRCDVCGEENAVIQVQEIVDGKQSSLKLCGSCAATQKFRLSKVAGGAVRKLLESVSELAARMAEQTDDPCCVECGLDETTFRNTGLLGCPDCYTTFKDLLREHFPGAAEHVAAPTLQPPQLPVEALQPTLEQQLRRAIIEERYEDAAKLRDQLQHVAQEQS